MLLDYVRMVNAIKNFKIKDEFEFIDFDDITPDAMSEDSPIPEHIEIWAAVKIFYEGTIPESYKTLNLIIGDWVTSHTKSLTKVIHQQLKTHFTSAYPNSDHSEISEDSEDSAIWEDQLEYMPRINEKENYMIIEIELVLESEPLGD